MNRETRIPASLSASTKGFRCRCPTATSRAALGRHLFALLRDQATGVRLVSKRDLQHLLGGRHLQIERQVNLFREPSNIVVGDVSSILAKMRGNAIRAGLRCQARRTDWVWMAPTPGVSNSGNVIDIDTEAQMAVHFLNTPASYR